MSIVEKNYQTVRQNGAIVNGNFCEVYGNNCIVNGNHCTIYGNNCIVNGNGAKYPHKSSGLSAPGKYNFVLNGDMIRVRPGSGSIPVNNGVVNIQSFGSIDEDRSMFRNTFSGSENADGMYYCGDTAYTVTGKHDHRITGDTIDIQMKEGGEVRVGDAKVYYLGPNTAWCGFRRGTQISGPDTVCEELDPVPKYTPAKRKRGVVDLDLDINKVIKRVTKEAEKGVKRTEKTKKKVEKGAKKRKSVLPVLKEDVKTEKEEDTCIICMEHKIRTVNIPCGHSYACFGCNSTEFKAKVAQNKPIQCATCKGTVDFVNEVFR